MQDAIKNFPNQLTEALAISKKNKLQFKKKKFNQVYISGLGGSGIGASIVQDFVKDSLSIPFTVNKTYKIAKSVNKDTLFIACSYSGNTEETRAALNEALKRKATCVVITSGGKMGKTASKNKLQHIIIPGGMQPRACLGFSLVQILHILHQSKLLKTSVQSMIGSVSALLVKNQKDIQKQSKKIAKQLIGKKIVTYTTTGYEGLAVRFRQQLNENSKMLGWHAIIPEMTHNEIVGWRTKSDDLAIVVFKDQKASAKNKKRLTFLLGAIKKYCKNINELEAKGKTYWERAFYLIHLGDWISWELSVLGKMDASEIEIINALKSAMSRAKN